jgi:hypothetical protein
MGSKSQSNCGVHVPATDGPDSVRHRNHDQPKCEGDTHMRDGPNRHFINNNRPRASKYQSECANKFGQKAPEYWHGITTF